jgi:hypothetical protein
MDAKLNSKKHLQKPIFHFYLSFSALLASTFAVFFSQQFDMGIKSVEFDAGFESVENNIGKKFSGKK